jgi:hypothetical protein
MLRYEQYRSFRGWWKWEVWERITHIPYGVRNIFRWAPVIWNDHDYDWAKLAHLMEYKLERMAKALENGASVDGAQYAAECREVAAILSRLREDANPLYELAEETCGYRILSRTEKRLIWDVAVGRVRRDLVRLGQLMQRIQHWWD